MIQKNCERSFKHVMGHNTMKTWNALEIEYLLGESFGAT